MSSKNKAQQVVTPGAVNVPEFQTQNANTNLAVSLVAGQVTATKTSQKVVCTVKVVDGDKTYQLHIVEYGSYITDVVVQDLEGKTVYKSTKFSVQDALTHQQISDIKAAKQAIINIRKQVKSAK